MNTLVYAFFMNKTRFEFAQETYDCPVIFLLTGGKFTYQLNRQHLTRTIYSAAECAAAKLVLSSYSARKRIKHRSNTY